MPNGDGSVTGFSTPPGALFQAPAVTAPTTIPVTVTDGTLTKTISITVQPDLTGGHWGTADESDAVPAGRLLLRHGQR